MTTYIYYGDTLYHHGILGQKWGVRRFQNKDGSYTSAGKDRYGRGLSKKAYKALTSEKAQKTLRNFAKATDSLRNPYKIEENPYKKQPKGSWGREHEDQLEKDRLQREHKIPTQKDLEKRARILATGSAVVGSLLGAYGAYKIISNSNTQKMKEAEALGQKLALNILNQTGKYPAGGGLLLTDWIVNGPQYYKKTIKL